MDQRIRERLLVLAALVRSAVAERDAAAARLAACTAARPGQVFTTGGQELRRAVIAKGDTAWTWAENPGRRQLPGPDPRRASCLLGLGCHRGAPHTGIRIEGVTELSHRSLVQYRLPSTGELIPLLRFAPHDSRCLLITRRFMHGIPSHIAQFVAGHHDINTTMG